MLGWRRFGPYHHARADAVRGRLPLVTVELSPVDKVYAWDRVEAADREHRTVIDGDPDTVPTGVLRERVFTLLDDLSPGVVAVPGWSGHLARYMLLWGMERGIPRIVMSASNRHDMPRSWWGEAVKRRVVSRFQAGLVGGRHGRAYLKALGIPDSAIFDGYDVVDNDHFAAPSADALSEVQRQAPARPFFLTSARFIEKKNLPGLVAAYAAYRALAGDAAAWDLVILGDGPLRDAIVAKCQALDVAPFVTLPGFKQYPELPAWYARAGCFLLGSTTEQWGLVVNEAMAAGLPVIVSDRCGCAADLVEPGRNGFTLDPLDTQGWAAAMHRVAHADADRARMAALSREIIAKWGPARFADGLAKAVEVARQAKVEAASGLDRALLGALARR
ncbi:MAG: glycosyltransferase [Rhodospirillales bacterium]|nr:MAG: glycosyltransferase [Rhodospirillales bacterium]